ncbi:MAG: hypothetical protein ACR2K1_13690, partial [Saprospiraceae bacterium]
MSAIPLLFSKSHVKAHDRRLPSGKVIHIQAHEDKRTKRAERDDRTADMSVEGAPSQAGMINVDGTMRPTTNSAGRPIHSTEEGIRSFWRWFGDSKAVDAESRPLVVYHGTPTGGFTEFDPSFQGRTGGRARGGFSFTTNRAAAEAYANRFDDETVILDDAIKLANQAIDGADKAALESAGFAPESRFYWGAVDDNQEFFDYLEEIAAAIEGKSPQSAAMLRQAANLEKTSNPQVYEAYLNVPESAKQLKATPETLGEVVHNLDVRNESGRAAIVAMPNGEQVFYVADPAQIKSAIGNRGTFSPDSPNIIQEPLTDAQFRRQLDLFLDLESTDPGQSGPEAEAAKRAAAEAVTSLRGSKRGVLGP